MEDLLRYTVDTQTFSTLINGNFIYLDKTDFIYKMAKNYRYVFLSRPRRFGKSLLCSIFLFEFKLNKSAAEALAQIDENKYAQKFSFEGKQVWKIGVNFSSKKRTVDEWKIEK